MACNNPIIQSECPKIPKAPIMKDFDAKEKMMELLLVVHSTIQEKMNHLEKDNVTLNEKIQLDEHRSNRLICHYQKELDDKNLEIRNLQKKIIQSELDYEKTVTGLQRKAEITLQSCHYSYLKMLQGLKKKLFYTETNLHEIEHFRQEKRDIQQNNQKLEKTIQDMKEQHKLNVQTIFHDNSNERFKLENRMNCKLNEIRTNASEIVTKDIGSMLEIIMSDHVKLRKQIKTQLNVIHDLVKEKEQSDKIIDTFQSDIKMFRSKEKKLTKLIQQMYEDNQIWKKNETRNSIQRLHNNNTITTKSKEDIVEQYCPTNQSSSLNHNLDQTTHETKEQHVNYNNKGEEPPPSYPLYSNKNDNTVPPPRIIHRPNKMQRYFIRRGKDLSKAEDMLINTIVRIMCLEEHKSSYHIPNKDNIASNRLTVGNIHDVRLLLLSFIHSFIYLFIFSC